MVTIDSAEQVWQSPDGVKVMFRVVTSEGKVFKTWSKTIGKEGWSGEVEEYEKDGEKFIKQPYSASAGRGSGTKVFKADPESRASIENQKALAEAVNVVKDYFTFSEEKPQDLVSYKKLVMNTYVTLKGILDTKPTKENSIK